MIEKSRRAGATKQITKRRSRSRRRQQSETKNKKKQKEEENNQKQQLLLLAGCCAHPMDQGEEAEPSARRPRPGGKGRGKRSQADADQDMAVILFTIQPAPYRASQTPQAQNAIKSRKRLAPGAQKVSTKSLELSGKSPTVIGAWRAQETLVKGRLVRNSLSLSLSLSLSFCFFSLLCLSFSVFLSLCLSLSLSLFLSFSLSLYLSFFLSLSFSLSLSFFLSLSLFVSLSLSFLLSLSLYLSLSIFLSRCLYLKNFKIALRDLYFKWDWTCQASRPPNPYFYSLQNRKYGEFWRSGLKFSSEIEVFKRDWKFQVRLIFFNFWALRDHSLSWQIHARMLSCVSGWPELPGRVPEMKEFQECGLVGVGQKMGTRSYHGHNALQKRTGTVYCRGVLLQDGWFAHSRELGDNWTITMFIAGFPDGSARPRNQRTKEPPPKKLTILRILDKRDWDKFEKGQRQSRLRMG